MVWSASILSIFGFALILGAIVNRKVRTGIVVNWEERFYAILGILLLTLPYFGVTSFTISEVIKSVGLSVDTTSRVAFTIVLMGITAAIVGFLQIYTKRLQRKGPEATLRFRRWLWRALSAIALVLAILYASMSILLLAYYPALTELGVLAVGSFIFGTVCSVSFTASVLTDGRPPSRLALPLVISPIVIITAVGIGLVLVTALS